MRLLGEYVRLIGVQRNPIGRLGLLALFVGAIGGAGCSKGSAGELSLTAVELPGFSLALPADGSAGSAGSAADPWSTKLSYERGELDRRVPSLNIQVAWSPGGLWTVVELGDLAKAAGIDSTKPVAIAAADGLSTVTYRGHVKQNQVLISAVVCGARRVEVWTGSPSAADGLHRRILASLRCSPDVAKDREIAAQVPDRAQLDSAIGSRAPARFDLADRAGWKRFDAKPERELVTLASPTGSSLTAFGFEHEPSDQALEQMLKRDGIKLGTGSPRSLILPPTMRGVGLLRTLHCDDGWVVLMYLERATAVTRPDVITGAHCLGAGEPDVVW